MRARVRMMEAFGWILDDYEDSRGNKVVMKFYRPFERPNREKIRELEFAFSRVSHEESVQGIKVFIVVIVCLFLASLAWLYLRDLRITWSILLFSVTGSAALLSGDSIRLARKREAILREARYFTSGKKPPTDYFDKDKWDGESAEMSKGDS